MSGRIAVSTQGGGQVADCRDPFRSCPKVEYMCVGPDIISPVTIRTILKRRLWPDTMLGRVLLVAVMIIVVLSLIVLATNLHMVPGLQHDQPGLG